MMIEKFTVRMINEFMFKSFHNVYYYEMKQRHFSRQKNEFQIEWIPPKQYTKCAMHQREFSKEKKKQFENGTNCYCNYSISGANDSIFVEKYKHNFVEQNNKQFSGLMFAFLILQILLYTHVHINAMLAICFALNPLDGDIIKKETKL